MHQKKLKELIEHVNFGLGLNFDIYTSDTEPHIVLDHCNQEDYEFILNKLCNSISEFPIYEDGATLCSSCYNPVLHENAYCSNCGQKIYWCE